MNVENELEIINSTALIANFSNNELIDRAKSFQGFKDFLKEELKDGIDFGQIPNVDKPCLFKAGGEKIQLLMGLTPQYKLLNREFLQNQNITYKTWNEDMKKYDYASGIRNYYSWEWSCELWFGNKKVAEGVGAGNSEERKFVSQYKKSETPSSLANTIMKISKKRAFMDAILAVCGVSDMFTQDMDDDKVLNTLKVDKTTKLSKLSKSNIKTIYATLGALELGLADLEKILSENGYTKIQDCKNDDCNKIIQCIKKLAVNKKKGDI